MSVQTPSAPSLPDDLASAISPVSVIVDELRAGRMVILVDEEDRENEGDLVMAAEFVTPEAINFMVTHARGLVCLTLTEERCRQLDLPLMSNRNGTPYGTNFTVSIEAAEGVETGISVADRAKTVQVAVAKDAKPTDLVQPGHIFPLRAVPGGVLVRAGHTEAGCDLTAMAGLTPASVICEILKEDEARITRQRVAPGQCEWNEAGALVNPEALPEARDIAPGYISRYVDFFGECALRGLRIGVYQHSSVGRDIVCQVLAALGAEVLPLGRSDTFIPVDTEAVRAEDIALARQWAAEHELDAIASTDGDADRPLLADHTGEWLRGDVLGVICARAIGAGCVVTPVSSNTVVEECGAFRRVWRTKIGSPYVIAQMDAALAAGEGVVCGYEANGGFLLASDAVRGSKRLPALPTRDAVLPIVSALVAARPGRLADLVTGLSARVTFSDRLQDFAPARRDALMAWLVGNGGAGRDAALDAEFGVIAGARLTSVNVVDGVRMTFGNGQIIHLRGSGNAPELRCYAEAEAAGVAEALSRAALALVNEKFPA